MDKQDALPEWNKLPSDWRVSRCLGRAEVELKAVDFMRMVDQDYKCGPHAPPKTKTNPVDCSDFYTRGHRTRTECPYSIHYVTPESTRSLFAAHTRHPSQVCLPGKDGACSCSAVAAA